MLILLRQDDVDILDKLVEEAQVVVGALVRFQYFLTTVLTMLILKFNFWNSGGG